VAAGLQFRILGPLEVRRGGKPIPIAGPRRRLLLALLLFRANETVPSDELVEDLWDGRAPRAAKASLHNQVARLRKLLGSDAVETHSSAYRLEVAPNQLDLSRFERLLDESRSAAPEIRAEKLREALVEWRGPPLSDVPSAGALQIEILRLEELRLVALEDRVESDLDLGEGAELVPELESLVEHHPLRERLWGHLMLALYRSGRQAEALDTYRRAHATLVEKLGIEPGPTLKELQRAILVQDRRVLDPGGDSRELIERIVPLLPTADERYRARTVYEYGVALWLLGERDRSQAALDEAVRLAAANDDPALEELAGLRSSWQALFIKRTSNAAHLARSRRARRVFEEQDDRANLAEALAHEARMLRDTGRAAEAAAAFTRAAQLGEELGDLTQECVFRQSTCVALAVGPMPVEQAIRRCEAEIAIVSERDWARPFMAFWAVGLLYAQRGEQDRALAQFELAEDTCRKTEIVDGLALTSFFRSWVYELDDDWANAESELRSSFEQFAAAADRGMRQLVAGRLARALVRTGNLDEAEELATMASRTGDAADFSEQVAWRQGMALVDSHRGRHAQARTVAHEAVALCERSDWLNLHAETLENLAEVEVLAGNTEDACSALDVAIDLYERKGNRVALERARRTLGQVEVESVEKIYGGVRRVDRDVRGDVEQRL
jgi:DNA-binding SARP family transcriptional activator